jgi:hypothetical protein
VLSVMAGCWWGSAAAARAWLAWRDMRWRAEARPRAISASVMVALGEMMASGWGRQVLRSEGISWDAVPCCWGWERDLRPSKESGKPVFLALPRRDMVEEVVGLEGMATMESVEDQLSWEVLRDRLGRILCIVGGV